MFAYWSGSVAGFAESDAGQIAEKVPRATLAWRTGGAQHVREHIAILRHGLGNCPADWRVLLGYPLLRLGRRIDAIIITSAAILVLCFRSRNGSAERALAEDHALDLWHFHEASRTHPVVPLLVSPQASDTVRVWPLLWHGVTPVIEASPAGLGGTLREIVSRVPSPARALTPLGWERAPYRPAVSIIEAARMLFARHTVDEITTARAELRHLLGTMASIKAAIGRARAQRRHVIVFVTGAPGSGKTLCGLHAVFGSNDRAAFLTGNLPLVHVLRAALAGDARAQGRNPRAARQQAESAIQPLLGFLRDNISRPDPPDEHVIVFDEAQRAWDAEFGSRRFGHPASEAALFLDIMGRHQDWAAIVALVGPGQEINTGEAGLAAWAEALATHPEWSAVAAPGAFDELTQGPLQAELDADLHLPASVRGLHSHMAAPWADAVLANEPGRAAKVASAASVWLTRSLAEMRAYLRRQSRGTRRAGLVCSSFAVRLRAEGIWPHFPHLD
ncbi:MAG: DUF2075 domain-containing protein, partial [Acetobacteraceae bacterium]|nr:DUF2075 domain-containing protein [Acetobacteraceae bacterium]